MIFYYRDLLPGDLIVSGANTAMMIISITGCENAFHRYVWLPVFGHTARFGVGYWDFHFMASMLPHDKVYRDGNEIR